MKSAGESDHRVDAEAVTRHLEQVRTCTRCPAMHRPAVVGRCTTGRILLVGQAPGDKEPVLQRPFAWTAGKTLFKWFDQALGWTEDELRDRVYFAAVCRCFPGKRPKGGDRVPELDEIERCGAWLEAEFRLLHPTLVIPVGKLAIGQFLPVSALAEVVGRSHKIVYRGFSADCIPLPHPSGASTWHRMEPGQSLLGEALRLLAQHPAVTGVG